MIDIHSHILWDLDDGPKTYQESLDMLKMAADSGTTAIVATPHANFQYRFQEAITQERVTELSRNAAAPGIYAGCELHLSFENIHDALNHPARYTICSGDYLLVEFPEATILGMGRVLETFLDRGLKPIIAHPERHTLLRQINGEFRQWIEMGCLVQLTAQSLLGRFGRRSEEAGWEMISRGTAHFVASDGHDLQDRIPRLDQTFDAVATRMGRDQAELLFVTNPQAIISTESVCVEAPAPRRWYHRGV
jgi:protein-tyrosine phosphatase